MMFRGTIRQLAAIVTLTLLWASWNPKAADAYASGTLTLYQNQASIQVTTKEPTQVIVQLTDQQGVMTELTYKDRSESTKRGYNDNNDILWSVKFSPKSITSLPASIRFSDDGGASWVSMAKQNGDIFGIVGDELAYPYRISASETYSSLSANSSGYVKPSDELFRFTPSNDTIHYINLTDNMDAIQFNFGSANTLVWEHIQASDFIVYDATDRKEVPLKRVVPSQVQQISRGTPYSQITGTKDSTSAMILQTAETLLHGHQYAVSLSSAAEGNEIRKISDTANKLDLYLGLTKPNTLPRELNPSPYLYEFTNYKGFQPGKASTSIGDDEKQNVMVTLNGKDLAEAYKVEQTAAGAKIELPLGSLAEKAAAMADAILAVTSDKASIRIPLQAIDYDQLAKQLSVSVTDIRLSISMTVPSAEQEQAIRSQASDHRISLLGAVNFSVKATAGEQSMEIKSFGNAYVPRSIVVDKTVTSKPLMVVKVDSGTGELRFVPASTDAEGSLVMTTPYTGLYAIVEQADVTYADIQSHWAKADIEKLASKFLAMNAGSISFNPERAVNRAEFAAMIASALGLEAMESGQGTSFTDVSANSWYAQAVRAAVQAGIVNGRTATTFAPDATITREEMAIMIARALAFAGSKVDVAAKQTSLLSAFGDKAGISALAQPAVAQAVETNILRGDSKGNFNPKANATRAEAAVTIKRLLEYLKFI